MREKKRIKLKIGVGSFVKAMVGKIEGNTREGIRRKTRKEVVGCVQAVVGKKNSLFKFEYAKKKYMSASLMSYIYEKVEVVQEADET